MMTTSVLLFLAVATLISSLHASLLQPIGTDKPDTDVFASSFQHSSFHPPRFIVNSTQAIPTNAWWGNIIHADPGQHGSMYLQPIWSNPYTIQVYRQKVSTCEDAKGCISSHVGLHVNYPYDHRALGGPSSNGDGAVEYYLHGQSSDLVLSATELNPLSTFSVESWDELGVTVSFANAVNQHQQFLRSSFVLGMAFVTVEESAKHNEYPAHDTKPI